MKNLFFVAMALTFCYCSGEINKEGDNGFVSGTIRYIELEGGFFGIYGDGGENYNPINLQKEFQVDGLEVEFSFITKEEMLSIHQWGTIIEIKEIRLKNIMNYEIEVGETFKIELASNATTGYSWVWTNKEIKSIVDSVEHKYIGSSTGAIGAGGKEIWTFKGIQKGEAKIRLEYCRSWDANSTADIREFFVKIK